MHVQNEINRYYIVSEEHKIHTHTPHTTSTGATEDYQSSCQGLRGQALKQIRVGNEKKEN